MTEESQDWVQWPYVALLALAVGLVAGFHFYEWVGEWAPWGVDGWQFILGLLVALPVGHYAAVWVLSKFRPEPSSEEKRCRARKVGYLERAVVGILVVIFPEWFSLSGAVLWASAKMAANWEPRVRIASEEGDVSNKEHEDKDIGNDDEEGDDEEDPEQIRIKAMSAVVATLVSLSWAVIGGLIIRASLPQDLTIFHP